MTYLPGMEDPGSDIMDQVVEASKNYDYDSYTAADVRRALQADPVTPKDFAALLSPAALPFLEEIAQAAQRETRKHFGNSVNMFTPLYIANYCENYCIYCGFNVTTRFAVRCLTQSRSTWKGCHCQIRTPGNPDPDRREPCQI